MRSSSVLGNILGRVILSLGLLGRGMRLIARVGTAMSVCDRHGYGWYNPYNHRWLPEQTYNSMNWYRNNTFMPVSTSALQRGDVVYYQAILESISETVEIIDSWPGIGVTERSVNAPGRVIGAARPFA